MHLSRTQPSLSRRHTDRHEEQTISENQAALTLGLHVTPAFRIAKTGQHMSVLTGRHMVQYIEQHHPIALIETADVANAIQQLDDHQPLSPTQPTAPHNTQRPGAWGLHDYKDLGEVSSKRPDFDDY
jgi:hypothetical protein